MTWHRRLFGWSILALFFVTWVGTSTALANTIFTGSSIITEECDSYADRRDYCTPLDSPHEESNAGAAWFVSLPIAAFAVLAYGGLLTRLGLIDWSGAGEQSSA